MAHVLNATLRLSQRTSTRSVSHVLSGSTRSLSSTSSPAVRGCAARNASFVTAHSVYRSSNLLTGIRAFSTKYEGVEGSVEATNERSAETSRGARKEPPPFAPSRTFHVAGLPFFTTEEDVRKLFEGCGTILGIRFGVPHRQDRNPYAYVSMGSLAEAMTIVESSKEEPYVLEGRTLTINWTRPAARGTPTQTIFFDNFQDGDLGKLRDFLGEQARLVENAFFYPDRKKPGCWRASGMIKCRDIESATEIIDLHNGKEGPDGLPIFLRFARPNPPREPRQE